LGVHRQAIGLVIRCAFFASFTSCLTSANFVFAWSTFILVSLVTLCFASTYSRRESRSAAGGLTIDSGNFGPLNANPSHQSLLTEDKGIGIILQRSCRKVLSHPFINDDNGRTYADFPTVCLSNILNGLIGHQKHRVSVGLGTCLQAPGPGNRVVIVDNF